MSNHHNLAQDFWRFQGPARGDLTPWQFIICLPSCATSLARGRLWLCMSQLCKAGNYHDVQIIPNIHFLPWDSSKTDPSCKTDPVSVFPVFLAKVGNLPSVHQSRIFGTRKKLWSFAFPIAQLLNWSLKESPHALGTSKQREFTILEHLASCSLQ